MPNPWLIRVVAFRVIEASRSMAGFGGVVQWVAVISSGAHGGESVVNRSGCISTLRSLSTISGLFAANLPVSAFRCTVTAGTAVTATTISEAGCGYSWRRETQE